ncbi:hypothetical protein P7228_04730 [Altererythrobacter arenosus]|uniref:Uncharacterized protein n=1 Tax=Altererythrobacter arenosus TaxID=3032592 RepID=A0ABY8FTN2_9SPHN|nr:hypothetical protein [Altererythrobacter sp. CAU 1644]WFL78372.1 hypothetical protein P7228_04730 [Altererythrobacter sp. CAU 1644]
MQFSDYFNLGDCSDSEWFDLFLNLDTELFVDPFLIYGNEREEFVGSHDEIVAFFASIFEDVARSGGDIGSAPYRRALARLSFPEFEEACLGLTAKGTKGAGSGRDIAAQIAGAIWTAIERGAENLSHFEEVQIFGYGIGPDRISDATLRMLLHRFAAYTQRIAKDLGVPTEIFEYEKARFDLDRKLWLAGEYALPVNPDMQKPVILVPKRYLRPFPTLNHQDFWRYCRENEGAELAELYGSHVVGQMPKEEIVKIALEAPQLRERYIATQERIGGQAYDFEGDPRGFVQWYKAAKEWVDSNNPKVGFVDEESFQEFVRELLSMFENYVGNQGGWRLLWNDDGTARREDASQRLFLGVVRESCRLNGIDVSREANIGRGPVDFKLSNGFEKRTLIEVKLARNTKFWSGLRAQLPTYLAAEGVAVGWFMVVVYDDKELEKIDGIQGEIDKLNDELPFELKHIIIDARYSPGSASTLDLFGER